MESRFELNRNTAGEYRFTIISANGMAIAASQAYKARESALKGIESVKQYAAGAVIKDTTHYADLVSTAAGVGQDTLDVYRRWGWL